MTPPLFFPKILKERDLHKALRRHKLKQSDIKSVHYGSGCTLVYLKKRVKHKPKKEYIPSRQLEAEILKTEAFVEEYTYLIEQERLAEIEAQIREIKTFTAQERELFGRAILNLKGRREGEEFYYHLVRFSKDKVIDTEIANGDIVLVSKGNPLSSDLTGTVFEIKRHYITIAFENPPPKWALANGIRIDLYINDITFKRMEENLLALLHAKGRTRELRNIILGLEKPKTPQKTHFIPKDTKLNTSQLNAIENALGSEDLFLIHGPPGTGKTSTLIELIYQETQKKHKVLAAADSNTAVDNMLMRLAKYNLNLVRIGHPVRIPKELQKYSIHFLYEQHMETASIKEQWQEVKAMAEQRDLHSKPSASRSRGMSSDRILSLVHKGKTQRGISRETMQSMASWIKINQKIDRLVDSLHNKEAEIYKKIIEDADVVLATNSMVKSDMLETHYFDTAVIDEGSQQMIPSTLIPISKAKHFIIAGDHKQLPPTVVSNHPKLKKTLFETLIQNFPKFSQMLQIQYRMHEKIMAFSNKHFYNNKLIADVSVRYHTLADLIVQKSTKYPEILSPDMPLVFVDTQNMGATENQAQKSTSFYNPHEAALCINYVKELLHMGLQSDAIGIITPYAAQIKMLKKLLEQEDLSVETKTVDGFQGKEKEVIVISFVRSNTKKEIGFLKDEKRLNVAITRAKRKLICIGNSNTLKTDPLFEDFLHFIQKEGIFYIENQ